MIALYGGPVLMIRAGVPGEHLRGQQEVPLVQEDSEVDGIRRGGHRLGFLPVRF